MDYAIKLKSRILSEKLSDEAFFQFCQEQRDLCIERNSQGEIEIRPPAETQSGMYSGEVLRQLANWNVQYNYGQVFNASTGFTMPNGAVRAPKAAWLSKEKHQQLNKKERQGFAPVCPDFVIELRSPTGQLNALKEKMEEYMANGCQLGWLVDPENEKVYFFRKNGSREVLDGFQREVSGENVLPGFQLDLRMIKDEF